MFGRGGERVVSRMGVGFIVLVSGSFSAFYASLVRAEAYPRTEIYVHNVQAPGYATQHLRGARTCGASISGTFALIMCIYLSECWGGVGLRLSRSPLLDWHMCGVSLSVHLGVRVSVL